MKLNHFNNRIILYSGRSRLTRLAWDSEVISLIMHIELRISMLGWMRNWIRTDLDFHHVWADVFDYSLIHGIKAARPANLTSFDI